jgi:lipopolysaccharide/colanic/teichoic acid biosynthesis glycosyltransferase
LRILVILLYFRYPRGGEINSNKTGVSNGILKRACDMFLSGIGLVISVPVWAFSSVAIVMESGGPIFIRQKRVGKDGEVFYILKFRSMGKNTHNGAAMKNRKEYNSHVTRVGKLLRATAMDELPQLLSIFKGHMSFVGPRPFHPDVEIIGSKFRQLEEVPDFDKRVSVRPGLTGIAQIFADKEAKTEHKVKYDLLYIKKQSFLLDVRLVLISFYVTLFGRWE